MLTGSVVLVADLIRRIDMPLRVGVIQARSYRGADTRPGPLEINDSMLPDIRGRDVLLVDDIFDTGHTLAALVEQMRMLGPARCARRCCCASWGGKKCRCTRSRGIRDSRRVRRRLWTGLSGRLSPLAVRGGARPRRSGRGADGMKRRILQIIPTLDRSAPKSNVHVGRAACRATSSTCTFAR